MALERTAKALQQLILGGTVPDAMREAIEDAYDALVEDEAPGQRVAVRSSATAEDVAAAEQRVILEEARRHSGPQRV